MRPHTERVTHHHAGHVSNSNKKPTMVTVWYPPIGTAVVRVFVFHLYFHPKNEKKTLRENYFTSSDPHHDMLGGGCQVRVVIENMMGRMENLRTLISGFLGLVILVRWALVTMFLS